MKKIIILTLFKNIFNGFLNYSIIQRAIAKKKLLVKIVDFRQFSKDKHKKVDDYPIGGGPGMVIALPAIIAAIKYYRTKNSLIILTSPQGQKYQQKLAKQWAMSKKDLIIICGHYEGFDARIINYVDAIVSLGDFVLIGGEIAAMAIVESVTRLIKGVITKESLLTESFENNLLDYDNYTHPVVFEKYKIPQILLSGNHKKIMEFRKNNQIEKTKKYRPDLFNKK